VLAMLWIGFVVAIGREHRERSEGSEAQAPVGAVAA